MSSHPRHSVADETHPLLGSVPLYVYPPKLLHSLLMVACQWKEFLPPHLVFVSLSRDLVCGFYVFPQCKAHSISADPARKEGCCCLDRDCHGLPWGFSRQPVPIPIKTCTHTKCMGFYTYRSRVGYNPRVSKPVQIKAWVHIKSDSNVEKNYQGLLNPNLYLYPYAPAASTCTGLQTCDIP